jgi:outer membrane protein
MMQLQTKMYKKNISIANCGYRPNINFLTTLQYQAQYDNDKWPSSNDWNRNYYSGITISIPIFDSWRTPAKVKQAKIEYKQSQLSEADLEDNLKLDIEQNWWNYQKARESLVTQGQSVEMAKRGLEIARVRFENGVGTQLELFESEVALAAAENNRVMAFYDLVTGYASLMKAIGEEKLLR